MGETGGRPRLKGQHTFSREATGKYVLCQKKTCRLHGQRQHGSGCPRHHTKKQQLALGGRAGSRKGEAIKDIVNKGFCLPRQSF